MYLYLLEQLLRLFRIQNIDLKIVFTIISYTNCFSSADADR